jgi:hypothetical protein
MNDAPKPQLRTNLSSVPPVGDQVSAKLIGFSAIMALALWGALIWGAWHPLG